MFVVGEGKNFLDDRYTRLTSFKMEHLLTVHIRTKKLCGDKDNASNDGTIKLSRQELSKLGQELDVDLDGINDKLIELKQKGEIKGYGNNFKVLKQDGITQPSLLEITGEKKTRGRQTSIKATQHVKRCEPSVPVI